MFNYITCEEFNFSKLLLNSGNEPSDEPSPRSEEYLWELQNIAVNTNECLQAISHSHNIIYTEEWR